MKTIVIHDAQLINEGKIVTTDILIRKGRVEKIAPQISFRGAKIEIKAAGQYLMPGVIDDQVHFREPGLTHKADIAHEARAGVVGGTTTFMEMPNTVPNALTQKLLEDKYKIAKKTSLANYSFFMGTSNDNLEEVLKTDPKTVCGIKIFMGASTGNMLVDNEAILEKVFSRADMLIATHCEHEPTIRENSANYKQIYGDHVKAMQHPEIRNTEVCLKSSTIATNLAKKHNARLHVLHISTAEETSLFDNTIPLAEKRITAEACVHHLWFSSEDYERLGFLIKCNPAIKSPQHRQGVWKALLDNRIDVIATDHAPHTWEEKQQSYWSAPAGLPLIQFSLNMMLEHHYNGMISLEQIVEKMCHNVAICFQIAERGFVREGYWADLVLFDLQRTTEVTKAGLLYKCGWSPLEGTTFHSAITHTIVSGHLAWADGQLDESAQGKRLSFDR